MKLVAATLAGAALMPRQAISQTATEMAAMHAFCQAAGAGNADIPGNLAPCANVQYAREEGGQWMCVGETHLGDSEVRCNMATQLPVVRRTVMSAQSSPDDRQAVLNGHCSTSSGCTSAASAINLGGWTCVDSSTGSTCGNQAELLTAKWTFEYATRTTTTPTTTPTTPTAIAAMPAAMPFPVPLCPPGSVLYFNRGECFDNCPPFQEKVTINDMDVCLPMITREADRLEESTLVAVNEGVGDIRLRLGYPLLPWQFSENVSVSFVVDVKQNSSALKRSIEDFTRPNECNDQWQPQTADATTWERSVSGASVTTVGPHRNHIFAAVGDQVDGLHFAPEKIKWTPPSVGNGTMARVAVTVIFPGSLDGTASDWDSLSFSVNGQRTEVYWPLLGRTPVDDKDAERKIYRQHVCTRGTQSNVPAPHCKHHFYFDAQADEVGNLQLELASTKGDGNTEDFSWAFANFKVELPHMEATFGFHDFDGACQLKPAITVNEHIERCGVVGVGLVGTWQVDGSNTTSHQLLKYGQWPFCARFSTMVEAVYLPIVVWEKFVGPEVTGEGPAFTGKLDMFESEAFDEVRRVPRYQQNELAFARQCLEDRTLPFELDWRSLYMSDAEDPENEGIFQPQFNLTSGVTVLRSEGTCVYFSFLTSQPCDWCFLHSFAVAQPRGRRLSLILNQETGDLEGDAVESQQSPDMPGIAVNTADHRIKFEAALSDDSASCLSAGSAFVPLAAVMTAGFLV